MYERVSRGYTTAMPPMPFKTKDAGLRLRVEREIRQEFVEVCRADGRTAAQVLREYMRDYIARNRAMAQRELFSVAEPTPGWRAGQGNQSHQNDALSPTQSRRK